MSAARWRFGWGSVLACACASAGSTLPPPPAPKAASELAAWLTPPPAAELKPDAAGWHFQRKVLDNGFAVTVIPRPETSLTAVAVWLPSAADRSHGGLAMMVDALRAGTLVRPDMTLINPRLAQSEIWISTSRTGTQFNWLVLPAAARSAVDLLAAFLQRPALDEREVRVRLEQTRATVQAESATSQTLVLVARRAIPGWGMPTPVDDARLPSTLNVEALRALHACGIRPEGAELVIARPVLADAAMAWASAAFGAWKPAASAAKSPCDRWRPQPAPRGFHAPLLDRPAVHLVASRHPEPIIAMVFPGPSSLSEYSALRVVARVLESRVRLRYPHTAHEEEGRHIDVGFNTELPGRPLLELIGGLPKGSAHERVRQLLAEVRGLAHTMNGAEVDAAKRGLRTSILQTFGDNAALTDAVQWERARGGRVEDVLGWLEAVRKVELGDCRALAEGWLSNTQPSIAISASPDELDDDRWQDADVHYMEWVRFIE